MSVVEFFNVARYRVEKNRRQEEALRKWERQMKAKK